MRKKILILGGTGAMGEYLVRSLDKQGNLQCVVTSRFKRQNFGNVTYVQCNAKELDQLIPVLTHNMWDAIVDFMCYNTNAFEERYHKLLQNTHHYIFLSSARAYAPSEHYLTESSDLLLDITDDRRLLKSDEYALEKARQEHILQKSGYDNWTIIRPYLTFSANRLQLGMYETETWCDAAISGEPIVFSRELLNVETTLTCGQLVADVMVLAIKNASSKGQIFNVTAEDSHTWGEILNWYLETFESVLGKRPEVLFTNRWIPYTGGGYYQYKYDRCCTRKFNNDKRLSVLGMVDSYDTKACAQECLRCYINCFKEENRQLNRKIEFKKNVAVGRIPSIRDVDGIRNKVLVVLAKCYIYQIYKSIQIKWGK